MGNLSDKPWLLPGHMYQYDVGWLIDKLLSFETELNTAIDLKTIHYADPIQWDITTQYSPNTVVVDPKTGTAYMSKVPVPAGILLTNADYWVVIFNYQRIYDKIMSGVAFNDKDNLDASKDIQINDLIWYGGNLYRATRAIPQGSKYIPGTNLTPTTIADCLSTYYGRDRSAQVLNDTLNVLGDYTINAGDINRTATHITDHATADYLVDADGNYTADIEGKYSATITGNREVVVDGDDSVHVDGVTSINRGGAVTEVNNASKNVHTAGNTEFITDGAVKGTINGKTNVEAKDIDIAADSVIIHFPSGDVDLSKPPIYNNILNYGAIGDGVTDCTKAIQAALDSHKYPVYIPAGTYIVNDTIILHDGCTVIGDGMDSVIKLASKSNVDYIIMSDGFKANKGTDNHDFKFYCTLSGFAINGNRNSSITGKTADTNTKGTGLAIYGSYNISNVYIYNCAKDGFYSEYNTYYQQGVQSIPYEGRLLNFASKFNGDNGITFYGPHDSQFCQVIAATNNRNNSNSSNLFCGAKGNARVVNSHFYSDYGTPKAYYSVYIADNSYAWNFTNCHIEGASKAPLSVNNNGNIFVNTFIYASFGTSDIYLNGQTNTFLGVRLENQVIEEGINPPAWLGAVEFGEKAYRNRIDGVVINTAFTTNTDLHNTELSLGGNASGKTAFPIGAESANFGTSVRLYGDFSTQTNFTSYNNTTFHFSGGLPKGIATQTYAPSTVFQQFLMLSTNTTITPGGKDSFYILCNYSSAAIQISIAGGSINGNSTATLSAGKLAMIYCDNDNKKYVGGFN